MRCCGQVIETRQTAAEDRTITCVIVLSDRLSNLLVKMAGGREAKTSLDPEPEPNFVQQIIMEALSSPLNLALLTVCCVLIYKIFRASRAPPPVAAPSEPSIPKMKKQDMTLTQLRQYDGTGEGKRVCVAVNGKIFDMTRSSHFYGPGGVYSAFAGHDATHALASFNIDDIKNESSDLSDLTPAQMDSVREWEMQFTEKYDYIGRLIKEGETPTEYSDEEDAKESTPDVAVDSAARLRPAAAATVQNMATEKGSGADEEKTVGDDEVKDVGSKKSE